jgi:hypothetical protein
MVPFALNTNRVPDDAGGRFFKTVLRKQDWPQGLWVVAPDGEILAFHYYKPRTAETFAAGQERWIKETRAAIEAGLKAFGPVTMRKAETTDPLKNRGCGCSANGVVRLAVYAHGMRKDRKEGEPVVDSAMLTATEWASFAPADLTVGKSWTIAPEAVSKLVPVLSPMTDAIFTPQPKDATKKDLTAKIESVSNGRALIRLSGELETKHNRDGNPKFPISAEATIEGLALFDGTKKEVQALLLVTHGKYNRSAATQATAGVIEWHAK